MKIEILEFIVNAAGNKEDDLSFMEKKLNEKAEKGFDIISTSTINLGTYCNFYIIMKTISDS